MEKFSDHFRLLMLNKEKKEILIKSFNFLNDGKFSKTFFKNFDLNLEKKSKSFTNQYFKTIFIHFDHNIILYKIHI